MPIFDGFRTVGESRAFFDQLTEQNSDLLELREIGDSGARAAGGVTLPGGGNVSGSRLFAVHVTNRRVGGVKPPAVIVAGQHARELVTQLAAERLVEDLVNGWHSDDSTVRWIVDHIDIWVLPCANPDGLRVIEIGAQQGQRWMWRKTVGNPATCAFPVTANTGQHSGTDLNRNFATGWGTGDGQAGDDAPCAWTHRGLAPEDTSEARAIRDFLRSVFADPPANVPEAHPGVVIDLHDPLDSVSWPNAHTAQSSPIQTAGLAAFGTSVADAPTAGNRWTKRGQAFSAVYEMDGALIDFAHHDRGVATVMIESKAGLLPSFAAADREYRNRIKPAVLAGLSMASEPYRLGQGPSIDALGAARQTDGSCLVTGTANDSGGVASVAVTVGFPPQSRLATPISGVAVNGAFRSASINFSVALPPEVYSGEGHTAFVWAIGNDGRPGRVHALKLEPGSAPPPAADTTSALAVRWPGPKTFTGTSVVDLGDQGRTILPPMTLCGWIKPTTTSEGTIVGRRDGNTQQWQFYLYQGKLALKESDSGRWSSNTSLGGNATKPSVNVWQHAAVTIAEGGPVIFYLTKPGGPTLSEGGSRSGGTFEQRDIKTAVGARWEGPNTAWQFKGEMRDVRIYGRVLSPADIAALAAAG